MKTQECTKGWRSYLTSSSLVMLVIAVLLVFLRSFFAIQENRELINFLNKKTVVLVNDEVLVNKTVRGDTINLYITSPTENVIEVKAPDSVFVKLDSFKLNAE